MTLMRLKALYREYFYTQDWYEGEEFAHTPLVEGVYYLGPQMQESPSAVEVVHFWIDHYTRIGRIYWPTSYVWTRDTDGEGNRVYVGGYEKGRTHGLQIHRHLTNIDAIDYTQRSEE